MPDGVHQALRGLPRHHGRSVVVGVLGLESRGLDVAQRWGKPQGVVKVLIDSRPRH